MIFNEITYFLFFLIPTVVLYHLSGLKMRCLVLSFFGIAFFMYYGHLHFGGMWGSVAVLIFILELLTSRLYKPGSKWCLYGIAQAIIILVIFKYLVFFSDVWNDTALMVSLPPITGVKKLILPLGISFFTFEFIHFALDCYYGKIVEPKMREYCAFIFFFPCMVAGPIKRFQSFSLCLQKKEIDFKIVERGVTRILAGLAKKHVLADTFSLWSDNLNTPLLYEASGPTIFAWITAYGMKIYFDFSAYSDIAIGCGNLMGIEIPENFNWPYFAKNIADYWKKWHISLMLWFHDFLFKPLMFGNAFMTFFKDKYHILRLVLITLVIFFISGLWHGANYNFIAWGMYHGVLSALYLLWKNSKSLKKIKIPKAISIIITFLLVNLSWGFFSMNMTDALYAYQKIFGLL